MTSYTAWLLSIFSVSVPSILSRQLLWSTRLIFASWVRKRSSGRIVELRFFGGLTVEETACYPPLGGTWPIFLISIDYASEIWVQKNPAGQQTKSLLWILAIMAGIVWSFAKTHFEYQTVVCGTGFQEQWHALALALRDQLFLHPMKFPYLLLGHNRSLEAKYSFRIPWSPSRQNALDSSLGDGHFRLRCLKRSTACATETLCLSPLLRATISEGQREEFERLLKITIGQIEAAQFVSHSGIRFPQNGCLRCPHLGLCLNNQELVDMNLVRKAGASDLDWLDELVD